jgi:hypothetical protein
MCYFALLPGGLAATVTGIIDVTGREVQVRLDRDGDDGVRTRRRAVPPG